ncbi:TPA: phage tail protein [Streptococcus pyogenes]|uniref:phage tail protein n=1 Tax=Streptococcus pyogenes TaxID=1314 RepID=UPI0010A1A124|nr:phage tail protein [Streptococcus pyogenes]VGQ61334.1 Uncharacterised protein [Streptococcus pyogenes]VGV10575.1 Uncharacterised protein [Streptococcus pyogenes]VHA63467.1 Uncharacterised protein [Streptococcus pyogenes]
MTFDPTQQFDAYEITNGQFRKRTKGQLGEAKKLGCTGEISVEAETHKVTKKCEGKVAREVTIIDKLNITFKGHMPVDMLRESFGLTNADLKEGIYGYGRKSIGAEGSLTFDVFDLGREVKKLIAFPNVAFVDGLKFALSNGGEEIAEVEMNLSGMFDENDFCYYETFEDDLKDESVKTGWSKTFEPKLVKKVAQL